MNQKNWYLLPFFLYPIAMVWSVQHDPFFWDTVQLASKHAHHFYENDLRWIPLPIEIDSGHPPVFGYYLATIWTFFGKTLPASHWAMLPFLLLNVWLLYRLGLRLGGIQWAFGLIPLVLLDPVMAGQSVLMSPDVVLVCGFLFAVEGIFGKNKIFITIGILMLCMISMRGMMTAGALFVWQMVGVGGLIRRDLRSAAQAAGTFIPGVVFAAWFLWWHQQTTGWTGVHTGSPWAPSFEPARGGALFRNLLVIGWRWLDFGRVFEWLALGLLIWKNVPLKKIPTVTRSLLCLLICLWAFLSPSALFFQNISAHRYFLPGFVAFHLLVFQLLVNTATQTSILHRRAEKKFYSSLVLPILIVLMALGNLWIYPRGIAMGWDATLAHLPFHRLRAEAVAFLEEKKIDFQTVGSTFPNLNTGENILLNGDQRRFSEKDLSRNEYFFASNVFNDVSEKDYLILQKDWVLMQKWQQANVRVELYQRRH